MARVYTATMADVAITAAQDMFYILAATNKPIEIHSVQISQKTLTSWEARGLLFLRIPATVTVGSGGSSITARPMLPNDTAASVTARINDTTSATSSGTIVNLGGDTFNVLNGFYWSPAGNDDRIIISGGEAFVVKLVTAPSASMTTSGFVTFAELV